MVRFQADRPYIEAMPVTEFAAELGVTRLVYVELEAFSTRSPMSMQLFRGNAVASLAVVEIENGVARVVYEENGIRAGFPEKGPPDGEISGNDQAFYVGTIRMLADEITKRLTTYEVES